MAVISIPLVFGVVPRNRFYGVRTLRTLADDRVWYAANRFCGFGMLLASLVYLATAARLPYVKSAPDNFSVWAVHLAAFVLPIAAAVILTIRHTRKL